jgi:hypothetical protein
MRVAQLLQGIYGGVNDIVRIRSADALGKDVLDSRDFDDSARRTAGNDAGTGRGGTKKHATRAELTKGLVRNRALVGKWNLEQALFGLVGRLTDRLRDFVRLTKACPDMTILIANNN